jgi:ribose-phosphate pyrophosphokinase
VDAVLLAHPGNDVLAGRVGELAGIPLGAVESRHFPDRESYLRIDADCSRKTVLVACTLDRPDEKILPLVFLAETARELGARSIGLVAPYLGYLRQDRRFQRGEAITSRVFAGLLSRYVDWLVTIDPHLHRYRSLDSIYGVPSRIVRAAPALAGWISAHVDRPLLIGPDRESEQWVADVAGLARAPYVILQKSRHGDRTVDVSKPDLDPELRRAHTPVVVDDIISSAQTMIETVKHLVASDWRSPVCVGVHALFSAAAEDDLRAAGAAQIVTTTSVPHATNRIDVVPLLIPAIVDLACAEIPPARGQV